MPVEVFCCYAREDQQLLLELKAHLGPLQRQGIIHLWADTELDAGTEWENEIKKHLNTASIILLLISQYFMHSDYCYSKEMKRALERHERGEARVIPIILRPVYWQKTPFSKLQVLPTNAKPIIKWQNRDEAFFDVAEGIRKAIEELNTVFSTFYQKYAELSNQQHREDSSYLSLGEKIHQSNDNMIAPHFRVCPNCNAKVFLAFTLCDECGSSLPPKSSAL